MFTAIKITDTNYKFKTGSVETEINGLNKINIFVGQNNSGKSRFMRSIFSNKIEFKDNINFSIEKWNLFIIKIENLLNEFRMHTGEFNSIQQNINRKKKEYLSSYNEINELKGTYKSILNNVDAGVAGGMRQQHKLDFKTKFDVEIRNIFTEEDFEIFSENFSKKVYIPMLRGLKNPIPNEFQKDIYKERIIFDYFLDVKKEEFDISKLDFACKEFERKGFEIFTGLSLYEDIRKMLLGNHKEREKVRAFEEFLSMNFFRKEPVTLISRDGADVLHVDIGPIKDKAIYDLGDGIQSIIINTFPLFKYKDENLLLFIEEPEMGIHPGMQRILLNTFANGIQSEGKEHQIYFTTHSNHFLDIALEKEINEKISVYQFKETDSEKEKHITNISKNKEVLDLLGVRNSSVFLSNCVIWVEGVSDRIYIKKFLELYQKQDGIKIFEEDKHFSIIEYGGGNITHFNFGEEESEEQMNILKSVNKNNFIVADNDGYDFISDIGEKDKEKEIRLKTIYKDFKDNSYLEFREIENIIKTEVYVNFLTDYLNSAKKGKDKEIELDLKKLEKIDWSDSIGKIMKQHFIKKKEGFSPKYFESKSIECIGIKKSEIAEIITGKYLNDYSDLSTNAKDLTEKLYKFIESNNK